MFNLVVQRFAGVLAQHRGDVVIELSILAIKGQYRDADGWQDETQAANVLSQFDRERVIVRGGT